MVERNESMQTAHDMGVESMAEELDAEGWSVEADISG